MATDQIYKETFESLKTELLDLEKKRTDLEAKFRAELDNIDARISHVKSGIVAFYRLIEPRRYMEALQGESFIKFAIRWLGGGGLGHCDGPWRAKPPRVGGDCNVVGQESLI